MNRGSGALANGTNRAFNFTDMAVGGHDIESHREDVILYATEFVVTVHPMDGKTTSVV